MNKWQTESDIFLKDPLKLMLNFMRIWDVSGSIKIERGMKAVSTSGQRRRNASPRTQRDLGALPLPLILISQAAGRPHLPAATFSDFWQSCVVKVQRRRHRYAKQVEIESACPFSFRLGQVSAVDPSVSEKRETAGFWHMLGFQYFHPHKLCHSAVLFCFFVIVVFLVLFYVVFFQEWHNREYGTGLSRPWLICMPQTHPARQPIEPQHKAVDGLNGNHCNRVLFRTQNVCRQVSPIVPLSFNFILLTEVYWARSRSPRSKENWRAVAMP